MIRILVLAGLLATAAARAQSVLGTQSFVVTEQHDGDEVAGCSIGFTHLQQDIEYAGGGFVQLSGTITLEKVPDGKVRWRLTLQPSDLRLQHGHLDLVPFDPAAASIAGADFSTTGHEATQELCRDGGFCATYSDDASLTGLMTLLTEPAGFTVSYRRRKFGLDVPSVVTDTAPQSADDLARFSDCTLSLLGDLWRSPG